MLLLCTTNPHLVSMLTERRWLEDHISLHTGAVIGPTQLHTPGVEIKGNNSLQSIKIC